MQAAILRSVLSYDKGTVKKIIIFSLPEITQYMFVSSVLSIQQATANCIKDQHMPFDHKPQKAQFCQGFNQGWKADAQKIYERGMQKACILIQSKVIRPFTQPLPMLVYTPLIKEHLSPFLDRVMWPKENNVSQGSLSACITLAWNERENIESSTDRSSSSLGRGASCQKRSVCNCNTQDIPDL